MHKLSDGSEVKNATREELKSSHKSAFLHLFRSEGKKTRCHSWSARCSDRRDSRPPLFFRHPDLSLRISGHCLSSFPHRPCHLQTNVGPLFLPTATPKCPAASPGRWAVPRSVYHCLRGLGTLALVQDPTQEGCCRRCAWNAVLQDPHCASPIGPVAEQLRGS